MKVKDLISELERFDGELNVYVGEDLIKSIEAMKLGKETIPSCAALVKIVPTTNNN